MPVSKESKVETPSREWKLELTVWPLLAWVGTGSRLFSVVFGVEQLLSKSLVLLKLPFSWFYG